MKRTRNSFFYKVRRAIRNFDIKAVGNFIFEILTALLLFGALFYLPHLFH